MSMPSAQTPLYNHPLPALETWLEDLGCTQDPEIPEYWYCDRTEWRGELRLEETTIWVRYTYTNGEIKVLSFPYSLSRADIQEAIFEL